MPNDKPWVQMTHAERSEYLGCVGASSRDVSAVHDTELVRRYTAGLPLTKDDRKRARSLVRLRAA